MNDLQKKWCVYKHTLKNDGRMYIGQTCNIKDRWKPSAYKTCTKFYNAILYYGWNNFTHEIIADNLTLEEANKLEEQLIKQFDTINTGFNLNSGGENKLHNNQTKQKMSNARTGIKKSESHKKSISNALKGQKKSQEHIQHNKASQHKKPVLCIETNIIYESLSEAERKTGILNESISRNCRGKQKTAGGYHWRFINNNE